jgi:hypothetical protein
METSKAMPYNTIRLLSGLIAVVVLLNAGIIGAAEPPSLDKYKPKDSKAVIKAVSLSASDRDTFNSKRVGTEFPEGTSHVVVWYRWEGANTGYQINAHWFYQENKVLEQGEPVAKSSGSEAWVLKMTGGRLPNGKYRVELLENGKPVTEIPFTVGSKSGK